MNRQQLLRTYGPVAVVTGATSGIGRGLATELAAAGFELVLVARSEPNLLTFQEHLAARHDTTSHVLPADLATEAGVRALLRATKDLDVGLYAAAAGFGTSGRFLDADTAVEVEMLRLNCESVTVAALEVGRRMANRGPGGMPLMSSLVGFQGMPNAAHYAATKAYVQTLAEALHVELGPLGVDVLAVAPGPTTAVSPTGPGCAWVTPSTPTRSPVLR